MCNSYGEVFDDLVGGTYNVKYKYGHKNKLCKAIQN